MLTKKPTKKPMDFHEQELKNMHKADPYGELTLELFLLLE